MKFQLITLVAALSLIAPVLASPAPAPHYDDKPAYCELLIPIILSIVLTNKCAEQVMPTYVFLS